MLLKLIPKNIFANRAVNAAGLGGKKAMSGTTEKQAGGNYQPSIIQTSIILGS
jgi:hypothetical protein